jgi:MFS family permease
MMGDAPVVAVTTRPQPLPLSRNRNYNVLWSSLLLSELANEIVFVAFPLLVLATSGSALRIGLVSSVLAVTRMAANLPAGVVADRWDRRKVLLLCQFVRAGAVASIAVTITVGGYSFTQLLVVAAIEGMFSSAFEPAEHATLPQVVPRSQLSQAVARNSARPFVALLLGPALAGFTFAVHEVLPFSIDAGMLAVSFVALSLLRVPRRQPPASVSVSVSDDRPATVGAAAGIRTVLRRPVIRATLVWMVAVNLAFNAIVVIVLAVSGENRVGATQIGLMMACLGAGGLLGGILAARLHAALPAPLILIGGSWLIATTTTLMVLVPGGGLPFGALLGASAFFAPVATTTVMTYQMMSTPAELRGRLSGVVGTCSAAAASLGPMIGGFLVERTSHDSTSILVCAAGLGVVAVGTTLSPTMRHFPSVRDLADEPTDQ